MTLAPPKDVLQKTWIFRMVHIDCLPTILASDGLHAPSCAPNDGLPYTSIHAVQTQIDRGNRPVTRLPGGVIRDYVGFYFGPRSPMLLRLKTGHNVQQIDQSRIVYLLSTAQAVDGAGLGFVFTDRHSLAAVAAFRNDLADLGIVDFPIAYAEQWNNTPATPDRQEKKQAEFLVHQTMPWNLIFGIAVYNDAAAAEVNEILDQYPERHRPTVRAVLKWYY